MPSLDFTSKHRVWGKGMHGLYGVGCKWRHVEVLHAGLGSIFPGASGKPVYAKKWVVVVAGVYVPMVMFFSNGADGPRCERFHPKVGEICARMGAIAEGQQMINRAFKQAWEEKK